MKQQQHRQLFKRQDAIIDDISDSSAEGSTINAAKGGQKDPQRSRRRRRGSLFHSISNKIMSKASPAADCNEQIKTKTHKVKEGERTIGEIKEVIKVLKYQVIDLSQAIVARMERSSSQKKSTMGSIVSLKKTNRLEDERKKVMVAIDYLQTLQIELKIQTEEAFESQDDSQLVVPTLEDIAARVQTILSTGRCRDSDSESNKDVAGNLAPTMCTSKEEAWCVDDSKKHHRYRRKSVI